MTESVLYELKGRVAVVTMNRPEVLNAFDRALTQGLRARSCCAAPAAHSAPEPI
jgi:enoyl-CoA hydratase/carnithine racemase